ncbi:MAG: septum formation protein Maf [Alistipes sp.]|nr:septum formation protein Maf [Candidatus Alistipes equi]
MAIFILASSSPRRHLLISECGVEFTVGVKYDCEEDYPEHMPSEEVSLFLSKKKSEAYPEKLLEGEVLVTADTTVIINGRVLGKPSTRNEAIEMLLSLSATEHHVITAVTLRDKDHSHTFMETSIVHFRKLTMNDIEFYVDNFNPYDKAGAYGIQEWIGEHGVERIEGSLSNIIGFPVERFKKEAKTFLLK